jgi:RecA-family ATPase
MPTLAIMDIPEPKWLVPGILSEGLNILAGKPKIGKSMMALNLALTIAAGGNALGNIRTVPGYVLYLSLEDNMRRVRQRALNMIRGLEVEITSRLTIATAWLNQGKGGLRLIDAWAQRCEQPSLVIIDVWGRFKPPHKIQGGMYEQDYIQMVTLKTFVESLGFHALVLMHCRKMASDDVLEEISGTMGLSGAADGILVLGRSRSSTEAKIYVTGRDVAPQELALEFNTETFCWRSLGSSDAVLHGKLQTKIINYMKTQPGVALQTKTIADAISETPDNIRKTLHRLRERGAIRQQSNAWVYPGQDDVLDPDDEDLTTF